MFHRCVLSDKRIHLYRDIRQQDLEGQQRQLEEERCDWVYFEKITGTKSDRPEFQKLLQEIQTGDTLVVTKLDRFARSTQDVLNTINLLFGKREGRPKEFNQ